MGSDVTDEDSKVRQQSALKKSKVTKCTEKINYEHKDNCAYKESK